MNQQLRAGLLAALAKYGRASNEDAVKMALISLQERMDEALQAYFYRMTQIELGPKIPFPELVDQVRDRTPLFRGDLDVVRLLVSLNNTRNAIAHDDQAKLLTVNIPRDAEQLVRLIRRFWPAWFGEECPVAPTTSRVTQPIYPPRAPALQPPPATPRPAPPIQPPQAPVLRPQPAPPPVQPAKAAPAPRRRATPAPSGWRRVWADPLAPRLRWGLLLLRIVGAAVIFFLANLASQAALRTARWGEPDKYGSLVLALGAAGLFLCGLVLLWRIVVQLRLKGLLVLGAIYYILLAGFSFVAPGPAAPAGETIQLATQRAARTVERAARETIARLAGFPEAFRLAYTEQGPAGPTPEIKGPLGKALEPKQAPAATPAPRPTPASTRRSPGATPVVAGSGLRAADCPHPGVRLTSPRVGETIRGEVRVEGSAHIADFQYFKFEYKREDAPDEWHWIMQHDQAVEQGALGSWRVEGLAPGRYTLRLVVVDQRGNYPAPCEVPDLVKQ